MIKGQISNIFAPAIIIDIELIVEIDKRGMWNKVKNAVGRPNYKLRKERIRQYLERLLMSEYVIIILDRSEPRIGEEVINDLCYTRYIRVKEKWQIKKRCSSHQIQYAFFPNDYGIGNFKKAEFVEDFAEIFSILGGL